MDMKEVKTALEELVKEHKAYVSLKGAKLERSNKYDAHRFKGQIRTAKVSTSMIQELIAKL